MKAKYFMIPSHQVHQINESQTIGEAANIICDKHVGCVVVVNNLGRAVGIITKSDLIYATYIKGMNSTTNVKEVMSKNLIFVNENNERNQVAITMSTHNLHHILVEDNDNNWIGLITSFDLAKEAALDAKAHPWEAIRSKNAALKYKEETLNIQSNKQTAFATED
ncbi:hypothetical protein ABK040_002850 [Willaertia magna]